MADFVAVLKKTLDGLSDASPEMREKVYDKARATIAGKLAAMSPPPPAAVVERQKRALEDAIVQIERDYAPATPAAVDPLVELENVFASLKNPDPLAVLREQPARRPVTTPVAPPTPAPPPPSAQSWQAPQSAPPAPPKPLQVEAKVPPVAVAPARVALPPLSPVGPAKEPPAPPKLPEAALFAPVGDDETDFETHVGDSETIAADPGPRRRRGFGGLAVAAVVLIAVAAVVLIAVAAGGYGLWLNRAAFSDMLGLSSQQTVATPAPAEPETTPPATAEAPAEPAATPAPATETSTAETPAPEAPAADAQPPKFTQRLSADGTESDPGPAGGQPVIGEGTSIASVTQPPIVGTGPAAQPAAPETAMAEPPADAATPAPATPATDAPAPSDTPAVPPAVDANAASQPAETATPAPTVVQPSTIPVGQRAIFYEERTNVSEASAEPGSIVWSLIQESPGGDQPPEPAIRAEATIPGKDVQLRMTIRRNADRTLPASHIIEVIFLTPQGFEGGGIDSVLRISMKGSEQEAGSPLLGIPAKIADGFFLIALNDTKQEIEANTSLLRNQSWIDLPVQYKSGRRALFTMEKGIPGQKVFDEAIKAWQAASSG
jgi:hypothetical protein